MFGTPERPRLAVFRSSKHIYAQMVNDESGVTIVSASSRDTETRAQIKYGGNKSAALSPNEPKRPVLTRFASTAEATSIMGGSRPWPRLPARLGCSFNEWYL